VGVSGGDENVLKFCYFLYLIFNTDQVWKRTLRVEISRQS